MPNDSDTFLAEIRAVARRARFVARRQFGTGRYVVIDTLRGEIVSEYRSSSAAIRTAIRLNREAANAR